MINYPSRHSEAEVQTELYNYLHSLGIDARLQVRATANGRDCKLDVVVFVDKIARVIVECKSWSRMYSRVRFYQLAKNTKQIKKYEQFDVPVFICGRMESIPHVIELVTDVIW